MAGIDRIRSIVDNMSGCVTLNVALIFSHVKVVCRVPEYLTNKRDMFNMGMDYIFIINNNVLIMI